MVSDEELDERVEREHLDDERSLRGARGDRAGGEIAGRRRRRGGRERALPGHVRPDHYAEVHSIHPVLRRMRFDLRIRAQHTASEKADIQRQE